MLRLQSNFVWADEICIPIPQKQSCVRLSCCVLVLWQGLPLGAHTILKLWERGLFKQQSFHMKVPAWFWMFLNRIDGISHCLYSLLHCILFVKNVAFQKQFAARKMKNDNLQYIVTQEGLVTSITETHIAEMYYTILEVIIFYKYNLL